MASPFRPAARKPVLHRVVPVPQDLPGYRGGTLRRDLLAGVTVAALALPSAMGGRTQLSGLIGAGAIAVVLLVLTAPMRFLPRATPRRGHRGRRRRADRPGVLAGAGADQPRGGGDRRRHRGRRGPGRRPGGPRRRGRVREAIDGAPAPVRWLVFDAEALSHIDAIGEGHVYPTVRAAVEAASSGTGSG